ncbi:hypothetical protein DV736_g4336, partial [Chaetothyriales sp. CBS 134916]
MRADDDNGNHNASLLPPRPIIEPRQWSTPLAKTLAEAIEGYYTGNNRRGGEKEDSTDPFGTRGDFITSPEISQVFGELVGLWFMTEWMAQARPTAGVRFVELGPGRGTLMSDILRTIGQFRAFAGAIDEVWLVEASEALRMKQKDVLCGEGAELRRRDDGERGWWEAESRFGTATTIKWVEDIVLLPPAGSSMPFVVAHEFFDALPIHAFESVAATLEEGQGRQLSVSVSTSPPPSPARTVPQWRELMVAPTKRAIALPGAKPKPSVAARDSQAEFQLVRAKASTPTSLLLPEQPRYRRLKSQLGSRVEISPDSARYVSAIAQLIGPRASKSSTATKPAGAALIIDYGPSSTVPINSLRGIRGHHIVSPFSQPGRVDLSADVDFTALADHALEASEGVEVHGPVEQGIWLSQLGIQDRAARLMKTLTARADWAGENETKKKEFESGWRRLVEPGPRGMGKAYKVMAIVPEGGAGLEADQRTLAAHGVYAMTATTALTAQNTLGVQDVYITPPAFVEKQIRCVLDDIDVDVVKLGMLASSDTIATVSRTLKSIEAGATTKPEQGSTFRLVLDPVTVSTSGAQLLPGDAVRNLRTMLLPSTYILTPNIPEATLLLRDADIHYRSPLSLDDLKALAKQVYSLGPRHVLLKGGHMPLARHTKQKATASDSDSDKLVVDILFYRRQGQGQQEDCFEIYEQPFISSPNTHGTGCSLASAIAANLATHLSTAATTSFSSSSVITTIPSSTLHSLIRRAISYVTQGIRTSSALGLGHHGSGPINHLHSLSHSLSLTPPPSALFPPGHFIPYLLAHPRIAPVWHAYTHHRFPTTLARGTLPPHVFKAYLIQDYHYLKHFARTYALAGYKSQSLASTVRSATIILHIRREMDLHLAYCADDFGLTAADMDATPESVACIAYSRYILDVGLSSDLLALFVALAPCLIGYGHGNKYWRWIENYVAADYRDAVATGTQLIEDMVEDMGFRSSAGKIAELVQVFRTATEMEVRFWDEDAHVAVVDGPGRSTHVS